MPGSAQVNYHPYAFESPGHWEKAGLQFDKATFTNRLHGVREIRNKVMHFSPDGPSPDDVEKLKETRRDKRAS
jgi:hypothetical protein